MTNALAGDRPPEFSLVMPVLNEGVRIIPALSTIAHTVERPLEVCVVYDRDEDTTVPVVRKLQETFPAVRLVKNQGERVIGAITSGFDAIETEVACVWVPYHVDPYGLLNYMYDLAAEGCELVSGNRFNKVKRVARGNALKKLLSRSGNYALNRLIGVPFGDITTSIKMYRKSFLREVEIETTLAGGWALSSELAIKAAVEGRKIGEVEFLPENTNIIEGVSNFRVLRQLKEYLRWLRYGFDNRKKIKANYQAPDRFKRREWESDLRR
ncbi:MAG: glycosyltransferase [Ignavibacteriales bacterium]|nr:glycosyltransferase [Ignavibacteriales bacterium]